MGKNRYSGKPG